MAPLNYSIYISLKRRGTAGDFIEVTIDEYLSLRNMLKMLDKKRIKDITNHSWPQCAQMRQLQHTVTKRY